MTVGDVQAIIAFIVAMAATLWAAILVGVFLFGDQTRRAQNALSTQSSRTFGKGFLVLVVAVPMAAIVAKLGGIGQILAWLIALLCVALGCFGSAGLAQILAARMRAASENTLTPFSAVARAAAALVAAGLTPVFGWFFVFPLLFVACIGAGVSGVFGKEVPALVEQPSAAPVEL